MNAKFNLESIEELVKKRKLGGLAFTLTSVTANASSQVLDAARNFGNYWALARSLRSDITLLQNKNPAQDLHNGTRTLHLAICKDALPEEEKDTFVDKLDRASKNSNSLDNLLIELRSMKYMAPMFRRLNHYCDQAEKQLCSLSFDERIEQLLLDHVIQKLRPKFFTYDKEC